MSVFDKPALSIDGHLGFPPGWEQEHFWADAVVGPSKGKGQP